MPDESGRFLGISVPELPWERNCKNSGLSKPECPCSDCTTQQLERHGPSTKAWQETQLSGRQQAEQQPRYAGTD